MQRYAFLYIFCAFKYIFCTYFILESILFLSNGSCWSNKPNLVDFVFKYSALDELKQDAEIELERRCGKYYQEHIVGQTGVITW